MKRTAAVVLLCTGMACANMAAPWRAGEAVGEPDLRLRGVSVLSELLTFDLRPLSSSSDVEVEATYRLRAVKKCTVPLVFVAPGLSGKAAVKLDQAVLESTVSDNETLPPTWKLPDKTPRPDGGEPLPFAANMSHKCLRYTVDLSPGEHEVKVHYALTPSSSCKSDNSFRFWQLGYVLAPARRWDGFANLEVQVVTPPGWKMAASLPLEPSSPDHYQGKWTQIPDDCLTMSAQAPNAPRLDWVHPVLAAVAAVGCCLLGVLCGRALGRSRRAWVWALPIAAVAGLGSAAGFFVATFAILERLVPTLQASWVYSYGFGIASFFLTIVVATGGGLINLLTTLWVWRRASGALRRE